MGGWIQSPKAAKTTPQGLSNGSAHTNSTPLYSNPPVQDIFLFCLFVELQVIFFLALTQSTHFG